MKEEILRRLGKTTAEKTAVRLFTALFITCFIFTLAARPVVFSSSAFFKAVGTAPFFISLAGAFVLLFAVFTFFDSLRAEKLVLLVSFLCYGAVCVRSTDGMWFGFGACLVLLVICVYVFEGHDAPALKRDIPTWLLCAAAACAGLYFAGFIGAQTLCRYLTQSTPNYDFAIFSQMFYNMKTTLQPLVTCERDMLMSHFSVHISPIYYLFLPFYALVPRPGTLMICQAVLLASGVIPVVLIARRIGLSNKAQAAFAVIYAFYPALAGGCFYDLHENKFLAPLLLWLFWAILKNSWAWIAVFSFLTLAVKEDAAMYVAFAGIYVLVTGVKRDKFKGLAMLVLSVGYFFGAAYILSRFGEGMMDERFNNFMTSKDAGLFSVVVNVLKDPAFVIHEMFDAKVDRSAETKPEFILRMMLPLGALPVITKKLGRYILLLPFILINLMPDYVYQHSIFFQYTYGSLAFLLFAAMLNYADLKDSTKRTMAVFASASAVFISAQAIWQHNDYVKAYLENRERYDAVRQAIYDIPEDATVGATTFLCATSSQHRYMYDLRYSDHFKDLDYIVLDLRYAEGRERVDLLAADPDFELIYGIDNVLMIFRKIK